VPVILLQTDTTVGFISQNSDKLSQIKSRPASKPFIKVYASFKDLLACGNRIPQNRKNLVRRSKKTTFIVKNRAFRVANNSLNSTILKNSKWNFSTSANEASKKFERGFCENKADIIVEDRNGLQERSSSTLIQCNKKRMRRVR